VESLSNGYQLEQVKDFGSKSQKRCPDRLHNSRRNASTPNKQVRRTIIMSQSQHYQDFQPLPTYKETTIANQSYVNVTLTRVDPDGSKTQTSKIVSKK
jgi:hypothetical protein